MRGPWRRKSPNDFVVSAQAARTHQRRQGGAHSSQPSGSTTSDSSMSTGTNDEGSSSLYISADLIRARLVRSSSRQGQAREKNDVCVRGPLAGIPVCTLSWRDAPSSAAGLWPYHPCQCFKLRSTTGRVTRLRSDAKTVGRTYPSTCPCSREAPKPPMRAHQSFGKKGGAVMGHCVPITNHQHRKPRRLAKQTPIDGGYVSGM